MNYITKRGVKSTFREKYAVYVQSKIHLDKNLQTRRWNGCEKFAYKGFPQKIPTSELKKGEKHEKV